MTTIEYPTTEKKNGSSRMTPRTDLPWWIVRPSLAATLVGSIALAAGVPRLAGITQPPLALNPRIFTALMQMLGATPTLAAIAVLACALLFRQRTRRAMRILSGLLALASLVGVGLNVARDSRGHGPIETWAENALANAQPVFAGK